MLKRNKKCSSVPCKIAKYDNEEEETTQQQLSWKLLNCFSFWVVRLVVAKVACALCYPIRTLIACSASENVCRCIGHLKKRKVDVPESLKTVGRLVELIFLKRRGYLAMQHTVDSGKGAITHQDHCGLQTRARITHCEEATNASSQTQIHRTQKQKRFFEATKSFELVQRDIIHNGSVSCPDSGPRMKSSWMNSLPLFQAARRPPNETKYEDPVSPVRSRKSPELTEVA